MTSSPTPTLIDLHLHGEVTLTLPERGFVYVYEGALQCGEQRVSAQQLALLSASGELTLKGDARALLVATDGLNEPVARYGPFVMNTRAELMQAFEDFQAGKF